MITLSPVLEVYITNVCNLTCRECNRFNNYNFTGHQYWNDHADAVEQWSTKLNASEIMIIGGEPTLNPDLELWASNLRRLWPNTSIGIQTNGTYIRPHFAKFWDKYQVSFNLSLHDIDTAEDIMQKWQELLGSHFNTFLPGFIFNQANIINNDTYFTVYDNDKEQAFACCDLKHDHTLFRGKLYKCPTVALLPEFSNQFDLRTSEEQKTLIDSYVPLSSDCTEQQLAEFVQHRDTSIDQCKLCRTGLVWQKANGPKKDNISPINWDGITQKDLEFYRKYLT
jgi:organic radical activating enzyme